MAGSSLWLTKVLVALVLLVGPSLVRTSLTLSVFFAFVCLPRSLADDGLSILPSLQLLSPSRRPGSVGLTCTYPSYGKCTADYPLTNVTDAQIQTWLSANIAANTDSSYF